MFTRHAPRRSRRSARVLTLASVAVLGLAVAACTEDEEPTTTDQPAASDDAAEDTAPADLLGEPNPATGEPVSIGYLYESGSAIDQSDVLEAAHATVSYVNEYLGGLAGHPIELVECNTQATPAGATDCANRFVDQGVAAVLVGFTGQGAAVVPTVVGAGIPFVAYQGTSAEELTTDGAFSLAAGFPGVLGAFAAYGQDQGYEKVSMVVVDVPSATAGATALGGMALTNAGIEFEVIPVAPGTPDMTPQVTSATSGADAVLVIGDGTFCQSFLQAYDAIGATATKFVIQPCITPEVISAVPGAFDGALLPTSTVLVSGDEEFELYSAVLAEYAPDLDPVSDASVAYAVLVGLARVGEGITGEVTPESLEGALRATVDIPLPLSGGLTFTCDGTAISILASVCSAGAQVGTLDAEAVPSDFVMVDAAELFTAS